MCMCDVSMCMSMSLVLDGELTSVGHCSSFKSYDFVNFMINIESTH